MRGTLAALTATMLVVVCAPAQAADPHWRWPLEPPHAIIRPFIAPENRYSAGHRGIDIFASSPVVLAPADGVVHFAGFVVDRPVLSIRHPGGLLSSYEPVETELSVGDPVRRGQPLGTLLPGHCSTLCLHFGVRHNGEYVSPLNFLGWIPRSILLPRR